MAFAAVMAWSSDAWAGTMIGGFLLGGQTCTFQWPASALGANMSSEYLWYLADFFSISCPLGTGPTTLQRSVAPIGRSYYLARRHTPCSQSEARGPRNWAAMTQGRHRPWVILLGGWHQISIVNRQQRVLFPP